MQSRSEATTLPKGIAPSPNETRGSVQLPADLEELVLACLARDPAERPRSAIELKKKLLAHLETTRAMSDSIMGMKSP